MSAIPQWLIDVWQWSVNWVSHWTVTGLVAVYGALLSSWTAFHLWWRSRRNVKVYLSRATDPVFQGRALKLDVVNEGTAAISFKDGGILLPDGRRIDMEELRVNIIYAFRLEPLAHDETNIPGRAVANIIGKPGKIKIRGYCIDAAGKPYKSDPLDFDVASWQQT